MTTMPDAVTGGVDALGVPHGRRLDAIGGLLEVESDAPGYCGCSAGSGALVRWRSSASRVPAAKPLAWPATCTPNAFESRG